MDDKRPLNERLIEHWHGIRLPNGPAGRLAAQLDETISAHAGARTSPLLAAPPADFAASLFANADGMAVSAAPAHRSDALALTGLAGQRNAIRTGTARSIDLLNACLAAIDRHEQRLNAILWQRRDEARAQAAICDNGDGNEPLRGVPLAHKDLFGEAGRPQTAGSDFWREHHAEVTATVMARLNAAGSYSFAGLAMAEFAQNPTGHNAAFGDCINPWNDAMICGGSSSGSAVAVSAGYCSAALGTDTGGSIRLPAACCGVTGLKPTYGKVSRFGVVPLCASLDCIGPIARTALDCAILLDVISGPDAADPTTMDRAPPCHEAALDGDLRDQRIGVASGAFFADASEDVKARIYAALDILRARGATIVEVELPLLHEIVTYGGTMARVEAAALHASWMREQPQRFVPHVAARLYSGYAIPATYYVEAMQSRPQIIDRFVAEVFGRVDALVTPTLPGRVPTRDETNLDSNVAGTERRFFWVGNNARPFNYLGLPALSLPCGFDANGLPVGLQLVGRPFAEARLLRIADAYQRDAGPPPLPMP